MAITILDAVEIGEPGSRNIVPRTESSQEIFARLLSSHAVIIHYAFRLR